MTAASDVSAAVAAATLNVTEAKRQKTAEKVLLTRMMIKLMVVVVNLAPSRCTSSAPAVAVAAAA